MADSIGERDCFPEHESALCKKSLADTHGLGYTDIR